MKTEIILFSQQLLANPRFSVNMNPYGWETTGSWVSSEGKITKTPGAIGRLFQEGILIGGANYRLKFTVTDMTGGSFTVRNEASGTVHQTVTANGVYDITFNADDADLIFMINATFDGAIQNCSLYSVPEQWNLELTGTESMPFNFSIDDIFELSKRKATWSKTITLPGTHYNNQALGHIYKINSEGLFDPRIKARAIVKADGIELLDGVMSVDQINKFADGQVTYGVQIIGRAADVLGKLGTQTIKDLDFSNYDHEFNINTLLFNWGNFSNGADIEDAISSCYDTNNPPTFAGQPGFQIQTKVDEHVTGAGTLTSASFGGANRVCITWSTNHPFTAGDEVHLWVIGNDKVGGHHIIADVPAANQTTLYMGYDQLTSTSYGQITGKLVQWKGQGYFYPLQDNGSYLKEITSGTLKQGQLYYVLDHKGFDNFNNLATDPFTGGGIAVVDGVVFKADNGVAAAGASISPSNWSYGSRLLYHELPENEATLYNKEYFINHWFPQDLIPHIFIYEIWTKAMALAGYEWECSTFETDFFKRLVMPMDQGFNVVDQEGQFVRMNDWLPGMKLTDFVNSLFSMFNLVVLEDKENPNKISIVSRNDFYDSGEVIDWEMDVSQAMTIKLSNHLLPKYYHFKYAESSDFYNVDYNAEIGNIQNTEGIQKEIDRRYGDHFINTGNQFSDKTDKVEIKFEPTIMAGPQTLSPGGIYLNSDKTISVCYHADTNGQNIRRSKAFRILIAGFRGTDYQWSISSHRVTTGTGATYGSPSFGGVFPYAAHIDNMFESWAPTYDLNWAPLEGQYFPQDFDPDAWALNTLIGRYWQRYLNDITDKSTKQVSGMFKLSSIDIYGLNFRNMVRAANTDMTLKLQKITDWDINGPGLCKCEFLLKNS